MIYEWASHKDKPPLILCSGGGCVAAARAMVDIVAGARAPVVANGYVGSAALAIFCAAKQRWATPSTIFLAHECFVSTEAPTSEHRDALEQSAIALREDYDWLVGLMVGATNRTRHEWSVLMKGAGKQYDVDEAKHFGLVTRIVTGRELLA